MSACDVQSAGEEVRDSMTLKIVRGPLEAEQNETILSHYNRMASASIPPAEFLHWVQDGPEGPAWHVVLEDQAGRVVGHSAIIPLLSYYNGRRIIAGKSEYSFILEEYQAARIHGFEKVAKPRNAIMIQQLFQRWQDEGLGPLIISTSSRRQRSLAMVGCAAASFPVSECLFVLKPWSAARRTPNLESWQRAALFLGGIVQKPVTLLGKTFWGDSKGIREVRIGVEESNGANGSLHFFEDSATQTWRYPEGQYEKLALDGENGEYLILKKGHKDRYLRVCQWRLGPGQPTAQLIAKLIQIAQSEQAVGVRWAVYGEDDAARNLTARLKKLGFFRARRNRTLLIHSREQEFLLADKWNLTDAMFCFDP